MKHGDVDEKALRKLRARFTDAESDPTARAALFKDFDEWGDAVLDLAGQAVRARDNPRAERRIGEEHARHVGRRVFHRLATVWSDRVGAELAQANRYRNAVVLKPIDLARAHEFKLCFVESKGRKVAHFTTRAIEEQSGDDWDDIPYERSAGLPSPPAEGEGDAWAVIQVHVETELLTPAEEAAEFGSGQFSKFSVASINRGLAPWLESPGWMKEKVEIPAGTTLPEFDATIRKHGGFLYYPTPMEIGLANWAGRE